MAKCSNCGREYRADLMAACPGCLDTTSTSEKFVGKSSRPSAVTSIETTEAQSGSSGGGGRAFIALAVVAAVGVAVVVGLTPESKPQKQNVNQSNSGSGNSNSEKPSGGSTGHYETQCRWVTKLGGGDAYGMDENGQVAKIKVRECVEIWVED
jgi:hypothetical protein